MNSTCIYTASTILNCVYNILTCTNECNQSCNHWNMQCFYCDIIYTSTQSIKVYTIILQFSNNNHCKFQ